MQNIKYKLKACVKAYVKVDVSKKKRKESKHNHTFSRRTHRLLSLSLMLGTA